MSHKRLTRSTSNRVLAGICGGLGNYFDVDPIIFRVIFCVLGLTGSGIIAYFILMFIIPSEKNLATPASSSGINEKWIDSVAYEVKEEVTHNVKKHTNVFAIIVGISLIAMGFFFLFPWFHLQFLFPVALIIGGILLLIFQNKKS
jgi:phage shock protein C